MSSSRGRHPQDEALARILQLEEQGPQRRRNPSEPEEQLPQHLLRLSSQELRDLELARQFERLGGFPSSNSHVTEHAAVQVEPQIAAGRNVNVRAQSLHSGSNSPLPHAEHHGDGFALKGDFTPVSGEASRSSESLSARIGQRSLSDSPQYGNPLTDDVNTEHKRSLSVDEPLAYARMLQERAFSSLQQQNHASTKPRRRQTNEPSDLEIARRMQELEDRGLGRLNSERKFHSLTDGNDDDSDSERGFPLPGTLSRKFGRKSQEQEDAKLARFMEESGSSIRELDEDQLSNLLEGSTKPPSGAASARSTSKSNSPPPPAAICHRDIALGPIDYEGLPPSGISNPDIFASSAVPQTRMRSAIHSAPTTPVHAHSERYNQEPLTAQIPSLNPLSEESVVNVPVKEKKKKKGFLGFGSRSTDKKPTVPASSSSNNPSYIRGSGIPSAIPPPPGGSLSAPPPMRIPSAIPPPPGGSLSAPPPMSPMPGIRRPAGVLPSLSPVSSNILRDEVPVSPMSREPYGAMRAPHSAQPSGPRPVISRGWAPSSPKKAPPRSNNGARSISPVPSIPRPGPLPHSVSVSRNITQNSLTQTGITGSSIRNRGPAVCATCRQSGGSFVAALDKKYHVECFRCLHCNERIDSAAPFSFSRDDQGEKHPYHRKCFAELHGVTCAVCNQKIPANSDGTVTFVKHPFFDSEQMCPRHAEIPGRRCSGCHRFEPLRSPFVDLNDGDRCVCYSCCRTVVVDSADVSPLWDRVLSFFEKDLKLPVWKEMRDIPILVVQSDALNDHLQNTESAHKGSSQIMARGLCLTDHSGNNRFKLPSLRYIESTGSFEAVRNQGFTYFEVPGTGSGNPLTSVHAILCLSGLPRDLTIGVLAHEATHAWIRLHPQYDLRRPLPAQVEEGCAQLVAMLLLTDGLDPPDTTRDTAEGPSDEKLRQYFKFSIERENDDTYGEGYRKAARAYSAIGIEALLSHVVRYREFPRT